MSAPLRISFASATGQTVLKMWRGGLNSQAIAQALGLHEQSVCSVIWSERAYRRDREWQSGRLL